MPYQMDLDKTGQFEMAVSANKYLNATKWIQTAYIREMAFGTVIQNGFDQWKYCRSGELLQTLISLKTEIPRELRANANDIIHRMNAV